MKALKPILSALVNRLEAQGFIGLKRRGSMLNDNLSLKPLVDFMSWMNQTTEAQNILKDMGIEWKQPLVIPDSKHLGVGYPVRVIYSENNPSDMGEASVIGLCGSITDIDYGDNGAQDVDPLYIVLLEDGRTEGFWAEELEVCEPVLV
jgi:hypothetical protein